MPSLVLDIGSILDETGASSSFDEQVDAEALIVGPTVFEFRSPVRVDLTFSNTGDLVLLSGRAVVEARVDCARCLEPFDTRIDAPLEAYFVEVGSEEGLPDEVDVHVLDGPLLDVWPNVEAALAEVVPFAPIHDPSCLGICPRCGVDLNQEGCTCADEIADSPFAVLKDHFTDAESSERE